MNREEVCLRPQFKRVLRLYGFDNPDSFLVDSCPESSTTTTMQPVTPMSVSTQPVTPMSVSTQSMTPMSVTTEGTVLTEMTPTSQVIQISTNITNGSASEISTVVTEFPAKVTYLGDASFTISNINTNVTNTSPSMNSQTDTMVVDIETQPHIRPIETSTNQYGTTDLINEEESISSNEVEIISENPNESITNTSPSMNFQTNTMVIDIDTQPYIRPIELSTNQLGTTVSINEEVPKLINNKIEVINEKLNKSIVAETIVAGTTPIISNDTTMTAEVNMIQNKSMDFGSSTINSQTKNIINTISNNELDINKPIETITFTTQLYEKTTNDAFFTTISADIVDTSDVTFLPSNSYVTSTKNEPSNTIVPSLESTLQIFPDETSNIIKHIPVENTTETMISTTNKLTTDIDETTESIDTGSTIEIISSTKPMSYDDSTTNKFQTNTIPITMTNKIELNNNDITTVNENPMYTTDVLPTVVNSNNVTENEIINEAESNQHYQIAFLDKKIARSMETNDLPTFNVEFVVRKEDIQVQCNETKKKPFIKPDKILTEYPKNSGISVKLRELKKRRRRYLEQCKFKNYLLPTYIIINTHKMYIFK